MKLNDRVVVITGAGNGLGKACAHRFAAEGARIVAADIDEEAVLAVAKEIGGTGICADMTIEANVQAVADLARQSFGKVDLWFSNAGISQPAAPGELPVDDVWDRVWRLHVMAHVYAARAVLPAMLARGGGYLLQTVSNTGLNGNVRKAAYSVTKTASLALNEWLAATYRPKGIVVSAFCPNNMLTPMLLRNNYPPDHPQITTAMKPEVVAAFLVGAIDEEKFLIVSHPRTMERYRRKTADLEAWIGSQFGSVAAAEPRAT